MEWNDSYSTGMPDIDAQHKVLFKYVNSLEIVIQSGNKSAVPIEDILIFLENYCKTHFGYEEKCMTEKKCPVAAQNKLAHAKFLESYQSYKARFEKEGATEDLIKEIHRTTHDWILDHIGKVDSHLRSCVKSPSS